MVQMEGREALKKYPTLTEIVEQLELVGYVSEDQLHKLENNVAFIALKEFARIEREGPF